jgi:hypothetical protein
MEKQFRFQDFDIWRKGVEVSGDLFKLAHDLESRKLFSFAEQLRSATLSITNNNCRRLGQCLQSGLRAFPEYVPPLGL